MASVSEARATAGTAYGRLEQLLDQQRCVMLDGGIATELGRLRPDATPRPADDGSPQPDPARAGAESGASHEWRRRAPE